MKLTVNDEPSTVTYLLYSLSARSLNALKPTKPDFRPSNLLIVSAFDFPDFISTIISSISNSESRTNFVSRVMYYGTEVLYRTERRVEVCKAESFLLRCFGTWGVNSSSHELVRSIISCFRMF